MSNRAASALLHWVSTITCKKKKIYGSKEFIVGKKEVRNTVGNREFSENGKKHITNLLNCVGA